MTPTWKLGTRTLSERVDAGDVAAVALVDAAFPAFAAVARLIVAPRREAMRAVAGAVRDLAAAARVRRARLRPRSRCSRRRRCIRSGSRSASSSTSDGDGGDGEPAAQPFPPQSYFHPRSLPSGTGRGPSTRQGSAPNCLRGGAEGTDNHHQLNHNNKRAAGTARGGGNTDGEASSHA